VADAVSGTIGNSGFLYRPKSAPPLDLEREPKSALQLAHLSRAGYHTERG
jgi:hypothetical protein